jgi:hypothetical protein
MQQVSHRPFSSVLTTVAMRRKAQTPNLRYLHSTTSITAPYMTRCIHSAKEAPLNLNLVGTSSLRAQMTFAWSSPHPLQSLVNCSGKHQVYVRQTVNQLPNPNMPLRHGAKPSHPTLHFGAAKYCPEAWPASRYWKEDPCSRHPTAAY